MQEKMHLMNRASCHSDSGVHFGLGPWSQQDDRIVATQVQVIKKTFHINRQHQQAHGNKWTIMWSFAFLGSVRCKERFQISSLDIWLSNKKRKRDVGIHCTVRYNISHGQGAKQIIGTRTCRIRWCNCSCVYKSDLVTLGQELGLGPLGCLSGFGLWVRVEWFALGLK